MSLTLWQRAKRAFGVKEHCACGACAGWTAGVLDLGIIDGSTVHTRRRCAQAASLR